MNKIVQALLYIAFAAGLGFLSASPAYQYADPELVGLKLSFSHATQRVEECVQLTPQQINERAVRGESINQCERERLPLTLELDIDGTTVLSVVALPSGLWGDGPASVYQRIDVVAGQHTVAVRLRDSSRSDGWDYSHTADVTLHPGHYFTITFRADSGGFEFR